MLFTPRKLWDSSLEKRLNNFHQMLSTLHLREKMKLLNAIKATIKKEIKVMVLIMSLLNSYQTLTTYLVLFTIEDCSWHNVNTRILNEELMTKKKVETSQVGRKLALTAIFETSHKE
jgi:hypothetical protein